MLSLRTLVAVTFAAGFMLMPTRSTAAESYDNCTGFIDSVPATISTQGVWCLRKDLATDISSGLAIRINTNNVVIDCNGFKLGGLAAGDTSTTRGIYSESRQNLTVRNCAIRGFRQGLSVSGGSGHLLEHNRLDNNLEEGISLSRTTNTIVRNNRVYDTGGRPGGSWSFGIHSESDHDLEITDNMVAGVFASSEDATASGIYRNNNGLISGPGSVYIARNRISGVESTGRGTAAGLYHPVAAGVDEVVTVEGNLFIATLSPNSIAISCNLGNYVSVRNNNIRRFATPMSANCMDDGGNIAH